MNDSEIAILDKPFQAVLRLKKRRHKPLENPTVIAFDIEDETVEKPIVRTDSKGEAIHYYNRKPVAITFAYQFPEGRIESVGIPLHEKFSIRELLEWALDFLKKSIELKSKSKQTAKPESLIQTRLRAPFNLTI